MDVSEPNQSLALPDDARTRDGVATTESAQHDHVKEVTNHARQEEDRGQAARQHGPPREDAEARRGRRRQERLARLMRPWWVEDPALLARELGSLAGAGFTLIHRGLTDGHNLQLGIARKKRRYQLIFEDDYPRGGLVLAQSLGPRRVQGYARHGVLRDRPATLAALRQVDEYLAQPRVQTGGRVLVPTEWRSLPEGAHGTIAFGVASSAQALLPLRLTGVNDALSARLASASGPLAAAFPYSLTGLWASGPALPGLERHTGLFAHVEKTLASAHGLSRSAIRRRLTSEVGALHVPDGYYRSSWHFVGRRPDGRPIVMTTVPLARESLGDRAPDARVLASRHVAIVGCGAVGWAVAVRLARSGVCRFTLYDDDQLYVGNLARLGGFIPDAGALKVATLADQLQTIAPSVTVRGHAFAVGRHVGAAALLEGAPDLLLNLTGEELSTDETNIAALRLGVPAIFAWVSNGVAAARIFRVRPFASACYECVRESGPPVIRSYGRIQPGDVRPWRGSVLDVEAFASTVAQVTVRTLRGDAVSHANPDHLLLDFGGLTPRARRIDIPRDPRCPRCR